MIPAIKKRWIEALRSGKYKQADGRLHDGKKFCCLGVLYDVEFDGDWILIDDADAWSVLSDYMIEDNSSHLSDTFREGCGISEDTQSTLITMNDEGKSFEAIATWIEAEL